MRLKDHFLKDLKLSSQSFYFYMEIGFAIIIIAVLLIAVPENFDQSMTIYLHAEAPLPMVSIIDEQLNEDTHDELIWVASLSELYDALEENRSSVGLSIVQENQQMVFRFILQGYENERVRNILRTTVETAFAGALIEETENITLTTLQESPQRLSDRLSIVPVILTLNVSFMGLFIIAAYIFLDKQQGTIKALAVTPSHIWEYLLGKMLVLLLTGLFSGIITVVFLAGFNAHYIHLIPLLITTSLFGSALGLFIASFFETMTKAMGWLYITIIVLLLAATSYYMPSFSPIWIRLLPSYPMIFAFREILLDNPNIPFIYATTVGFGFAALITFILANHRFKNNITV